MTALGRLVVCKEDMDIKVGDLDIIFQQGVYYIALIENVIYVIDRLHNSIKLDNKLFDRHFKLVNNI